MAEQSEQVWIDPKGGLHYHRKDASSACITHSNHQYILVTKQNALRNYYMPCLICYGKKRV